MPTASATQSQSHDGTLSTSVARVAARLLAVDLGERTIRTESDGYARVERRAGHTAETASRGSRAGMAWSRHTLDRPGGTIPYLDSSPGLLQLVRGGKVIPTAVQAVAETHDTPPRLFWPVLGSGMFSSVQLFPSQLSAIGAPLGAFPTAVHALRRRRTRAQ